MASETWNEAKRNQEMIYAGKREAMELLCAAYRLDEHELHDQLTLLRDAPVVEIDHRTRSWEGWEHVEPGRYKLVKVQAPDA